MVRAGLQGCLLTLTSMDKLLEDAQTQVDLLNGINTALTSLPAALAALAAAISAAQANPISGAASAVTGAYQQFLGRTPDAAELAYWRDQAGMGAGAGDDWGSGGSGGKAKKTEQLFHVKLFYNRKPGISPEEFNRYWAYQHAPLAEPFHLRLGVDPTEPWNSTSCLALS